MPMNHSPSFSGSQSSAAHPSGSSGAPGGDNPINSLIEQVSSDVNRIISRSPDEVQSYANQVQLCRHMLNDLAALEAELHLITRTYHEALRQLEREEYVDEELKALYRVLAEFAPQAQDLSNHVRARHMGYVDARMVTVTQELEKALTP